jgi:hypothetical protein
MKTHERIALVLWGSLFLLLIVLGVLNLRRDVRMLPRGQNMPGVSIRPVITRSATVAFAGDFRPGCSDHGQFNAQAISMVLSGLARRDPDMVILTGDYVCAWPDQPERARAQLEQFADMARAALGPVWERTHFAYGNHEIGHAPLVRAILGDESNDEYTIPGALRVIVFQSDYASLNTDYDPTAWLYATVGKPSPLTVFVRHEPWTGHGVRRSANVQRALKNGIVDLYVFGHEHHYARTGREIIAGNGGAKLDPGAWYGYVLVKTMPGQGVTVSAIDATTETVRDTFRFIP